MKIKRDKADALFSKYIRTRDDWKCQRCTKKFKKGSQGLHCSHFFGRGCETTRFDPENCDALCFGCHKIWGDVDREAYREFKIKQLGQKAFDNLVIRARQTQKKDRKLAYLYVKQLMNELENGKQTKTK